MRSRRRASAGARRVAAVASAVLLALGLSACYSETAGPESGVDVQDVTTEDFFSTDKLVGERVTVSARVTKRLPGQAFVLAGGEYGDASLLVLTTKDAPRIRVGEVLRVTGVIREFAFADYSDKYALTEPSPYEGFGGETFLVADRIDRTIESTQ